MAEAQSRPARIGILGAPEEPRFSEVIGGVKQGLRDMGHTDRTFEILEGRVERDKKRDVERAVVFELVRKNADVLFIIGSRLVKPARQIAAELPIVFLTPGDP